MTATTAERTDEQERILRRVRRISDWMDNRFRIPGTDYRFGLDPVIGIIPGVGDTASLLFSLYIVYEGTHLGLPRHKLVQMLGNVGIDWLVGMVPVFGDLFDFAFKANEKNLRIMGITPEKEKFSASSS